MECSLVCDKAAILRNGRLLEFGRPKDLIETLPSNGVLSRFEIEQLNEEKIKIFEQFPVTKIIRVGNDIVEVFLDNFEDNISKLVQYLIESEIRINSMSRDTASFRRYFQLRIQDEEEREEEEKQEEE